MRSRGDAVLETRTERELYRIVQEALNNVVRHAGATSVTVDLELSPDTVVVVVRDDGQRLRSRAPRDPDAPARAHVDAGAGSTTSAARSPSTRRPAAGTTVRIEVPNAG